MIVTRKFNTVLEEKQAQWAIGKYKEAGDAQAFRSEDTPIMPDDRQAGESVRESLDRLGAKMQLFCGVVINFSVWSDTGESQSCPLFRGVDPSELRGRRGWWYDS